MRKAVITFLCLMSFVLMFPVCVKAQDTRYDDMKDKTSAIYESMKEQVKDITEDKLIQEGKYGERFFLWFYDAYVAVKNSSIYIGGFSILVGIFLCFLVRHNKGLFRKIFVWLILGVPTILLIFCFGIGAYIG